MYTCSVPALTAGASIDLGLTARVDNNATTFTSNANLQFGDADFANNRSTVSAAVALPPPDVQISGSASTGSPTAGAVYDYRFQIKVGGNTLAQAVVFTDVLPAEVLVAGVTGLGCGISGNAVTCQLGDMPVGSQNLVTISVVAPPTVGTAISNSGVALAGDGRDIQPSNNSVTINVTTR